jgi:hypothetical protein
MSRVTGMHIWHEHGLDQVMAFIGNNDHGLQLGLDQMALQAFIRTACRILETTDDGGKSRQATPPSSLPLRHIDKTASIHSNPAWHRLRFSAKRSVSVAAINLEPDGPVTVVSFIARNAIFGSPPVCRINADSTCLHRLVCLFALGSAYGGWNIDVPEWLYDAVNAHAVYDTQMDGFRFSRV